VTVTATKSGSTSAPQVASVLINPAGLFYANADGTVHAASYPYQQK
jgi:hypothetical protein